MPSEESGNRSATLLKMNETFYKSMELIRAAFPNTVLLPSIGNNDVVVHNQVDCDPDLSDQYFDMMFSLWFQHPNFDIQNIERTFRFGGFYLYHLPGRQTSFLVLNSQYFDIRNKCSMDRGLEQLRWLEQTLKLTSALPQAQQKHFILSTHIPPGLNSYSTIL